MVKLKVSTINHYLLYSPEYKTRGRLFFFYEKMANFLHFYEVTTTPVFSSGVAYSRGVLYSGL